MGEFDIPVFPRPRHGTRDATDVTPDWMHRAAARLSADRWHVTMTEYKNSFFSRDRLICMSVVNPDNRHTEWCMFAFDWYQTLGDVEREQLFVRMVDAVKILDRTCSNGREGIHHRCTGRYAPPVPTATQGA